MTVTREQHQLSPDSVRARYPSANRQAVRPPDARQPETAAVIRIRLLGRFAVERDGQEIAPPAFGGRLARRLLRLLALRRGTLVSKEVIADALWPGAPPADAPGNIEILVSRIRRALGDRSLIRTGPGGYILGDGDQCGVDAEEFLAAVEGGRVRLATRPAEAIAWFRSALSLWGGEPLPEDAYADWAQPDRRHLLMAYLEALDGAAAAALQGDDAAAAGEAAAWAAQAVTAEPLREPSVLLMVRALAAAGNRAGALAALDEYRDHLAAETGLEPTFRAEQIRQHIQADRTTGGQPSRAARMPPAGSARVSPAGEEPFLGRHRECSLIAAAAAGQGPRVVLVTGPSGIGKTVLLAEAARRADTPVLSVQAFAPDQDESWSLAGRLLGQAAAALPAGLAAILPEPEAGALAELVPGIAVPGIAVPGVAAGGLDEHDRQALALQGAVRLVAAVAQPRCLIVADDLQWADPASLSLLGLVLRRLEGVSLAAACRSAASPGFDPATALGIPAAKITGITLGPLPARAIRRVFGDQLLAEAILREAGEGPFAITEVIAALARQCVITRDSQGKWQLRSGRDAASTASVVAAGMRLAARHRLAGLPGRCRDVLGQLALLGRPAAPALLAAAAGTDLRTILDTLESLCGAGLATLGPHGWTPTHELLSEAVTAAMRPGEEARCRGLIAGALQRCGADPAEVAVHLAAAGDSDQAAAAYADAAGRRLWRACNGQAARLATTGLSLGPPADIRAVLLEVRAEARRRRGELAAARGDFTAALDRLDDPASRSRVLAQLAILDARTADAVRGRELAALAIAEAGDQPAALGQALAAAAIIDLTEGSLGRARSRARRAARLLDQAGDRHAIDRLLYWQAMACFVGGSLHDAVIQLDRLARLPISCGEVLRLWNPRATRGHALALLGRADEGLAEIEEALAQARAARHPAIEAECLWRRAEALAVLERADEAIESASESGRIAGRIGHAEWAAAAQRGLGIACEAAGLADRAESAYHGSLEAAESIPFFRAWAAGRLGALLARHGQPREAAPHVQTALTARIPLTSHEARWAHAELLASQGDVETSRQIAEIARQGAEAAGYLILVPRLAELAGC